MVYAYQNLQREGYTAVTREEIGLLRGRAIIC